MKVVTVATNLENHFLTKLLLPSCHAAGFRLVVLHPNTRSFTPSERRLFLPAALPQVAGREEIVILTDAYDTLFIKGEQYVRDAYDRIPQRVVFGGDLNPWPLGVVGLALHSDPPVGRFPYLNSGGVIGPVGDILDLYERYPQPPSEQFEVLRRLRAHGYDTDQRFGVSDQYYWTLVRLLEPARVGIDHHGTIFEYYGPEAVGLSREEILRDVLEFRQYGTKASTYQRDRARLQEQLKEPSGAAQIHFASAISKAALLDLLAEGLVPRWLTDAIEERPGSTGSVQVVEL
jgi:hypothetical protein